VNYTTYDLRRAQDSINPRTHPDIMLLSHEDEDGDNETESHPYWYARVIGIYHVDVRHISPNALLSGIQELEFLWVRWFGRDLDHNAGWNARRLHRVEFVADDPIDSNDPMCASGAFSFIDPAEVICGVHLIPTFTHGKTSKLLGPSIVRPHKDNNEDWQYFYINMYGSLHLFSAPSDILARFVDRDMFMRFRGGGIGHKATRDRMAGVSHSPAASEEETDEIVVDEDEDEESDSEEEHSDSDENIDSDQDTDDDDNGEENLGPEDGEEGWEDEYNVLGFAAF
jgi:hypothetical protein